MSEPEMRGGMYLRVEDLAEVEAGEVEDRDIGPCALYQTAKVRPPMRIRPSKGRGAVEVGGGGGRGAAHQMRQHPTETDVSHHVGGVGVGAHPKAHALRAVAGERGQRLTFAAKGHGTMCDVRSRGDKSLHVGVAAKANLRMAGDIDSMR